MILQKPMTRIYKLLSITLIIYYLILNISNVWIGEYNRYKIPTFTIEYTKTYTKVSDIINPIGILGILYSIDDVHLESEEIQEDIEEVEEITYDFDNIGYIDASCLNVRTSPSRDSDIITRISWNTEVNYSIYNDEWDVVKVGDTIGYVYDKYISDTQAEYASYYDVTSYNRKSYMSYKKITDRSSKQYNIQTKSYTDENGLRVYNDRYCVAVGTYFTSKVGTYIDVELDDGTILPCVVGDIKSDVDTDANNIQGNDSSIVEFIVDTAYISSEVSTSGDISDVDELSSSITGIYLYSEDV